MWLSDTISVGVIALSLWGIYCIISSSRYKESSTKDGSLFVHLFIILLLWLLISFLSYPYSPKLVTCINVLFLSFGILLEYEFFANVLFHKPFKVAKYYYDEYLHSVIQYILDFAFKYVKLGADTLKKPIKAVGDGLEFVRKVFVMMCDKIIELKKFSIRCLQPPVIFISKTARDTRKQITNVSKSLLSNIMVRKVYVAEIISFLRPKITKVLQLVMFDFIDAVVCKNLLYFGRKVIVMCKRGINHTFHFVSSIVLSNLSHFLQKVGKIVLQIVSKLIELLKIYSNYFIKALCRFMNCIQVHVLSPCYNGVVLKIYHFGLEHVEYTQELAVFYLHVFSKKMLDQMTRVFDLIDKAVCKNLVYFGTKLIAVCSSGIIRIFNFVSIVLSNSLNYLKQLGTIFVKIKSNLIEWIKFYYNQFIHHVQRILLPCYDRVILKIYHCSLEHVQYIQTLVAFYWGMYSKMVLNLVSLIGKFLFEYCISITNFLTLIIASFYDKAFDLIGYFVKLSMYYYISYFANIVLSKQKVDVNINNRCAIVNYEYNFINICKYDKSQELKFEITINTKAFISNFIADIDGKIHHSETRKKQESLIQYQKAVKENKNAILISRPYPNIPNVFSIETNVSKNSKIKLIITIEQFIEKELNFNQLNVELLNPFLSYNINNVCKSINFNININERSGIYQFKLISPKNIKMNHNNDDDNDTKCSYSMNFDSGCDYSFNYNNESDACTELSFEYKLKGEENESTLLFDPRSETFCHLISNSNIMDGINITKDGLANGGKYLIARRIVLVIDKSQSMKGKKWEQTINATVTTLTNLLNNEWIFDKYSIILFNDNAYYKKMTPVNEKNILRSCKFLQNTLKYPNYPNGGTNINEALMRGLAVIKTDMKSNNNSNCNNNCNTSINDNNPLFINQMVLITDGQPTIGVTNTDNIIRNVTSLNQELNVEIFCFGICGINWINNLNYAFLRKLSTINNGFDVRINEMNTLNNLNKCFKILSNPLLHNLNIKYELATAKNTKAGNISIDDVTKQSFKTLYYGNDLIVCGKLTNYKQFNDSENFKLNAIISAQSGHFVNKTNTSNNGNNSKSDTNCYQKINITRTMSFTIDDCVSNYISESNVNEIDNIEKIWAYLHLQKSYQMIAMNNKSGDNSNFYQMIQQQKMNKKLVDLSLKFNFVTPLTNMIVVENEMDEKKLTQTDNENDTGSDNEGEGKIQSKIEKSIKLVVVGDSNCGKSSLLQGYVNMNSKYKVSSLQLPNGDLYRKNVSIDSKSNQFDLTLRLFDTPKGVVKYGNFCLPSFYCRNANGIIFVCSMDNITSQHNIEKWMKSIYFNNININDDSIKPILIINKCDLVDNEKKKQEIMHNVKDLSEKLGVEYFFTSAKQNINVNNPFQSILESICQSHCNDNGNSNCNSYLHPQHESAVNSSPARAQRGIIVECDSAPCKKAACC